MKCYFIALFVLLSPTVNAVDFDSIFEGKYIWGHEVHSFTPCGSDVSYWVSFNWAGQVMQDFYENNVKAPYQPMYLKFRGHLLDEKMDGFAEQYDGLIRISEVKGYSFEQPIDCH